MKPKLITHIIGRTLAITLDVPDISDKVLAKVDTGAYLGALWASDIEEEDNELSFKLFGPQSRYFSDQVYKTTEYYKTVVENSFGHSEQRYVIKLGIKPSLYNVDFTNVRFSLCDRSMKRYPILLGRNYIRGRFLVDVRLNDEDRVVVDEEQSAQKIDEEEI